MNIRRSRANKLSEDKFGLSFTEGHKITRVGRPLPSRKDGML